MGEVGELGEHERGALIVGQPLDVGDDGPQVGPHLDLLAQAVGARELVLAVRDRSACGQHREAAVASDRVEPGPRRGRAAPGERAMRPQEGLLERVLGLLEGPSMWRQKPNRARWWRS